MHEQRATDHVVDPYKALQVAPGADPEIIEAAYRVLARRYHPDLNRSPDATERMAQINAAWELLRTPESRAAYDSRTVASPRPQSSAMEHSAPAAPVERAGPAPVLFVEPERIDAGLRRGARRRVQVSAYTVPPGIRVETGISYGQEWLLVEPAVLKGLVKEDLTVSIRSDRLRPGTHRGAVQIVTSWETRLLPVELDVRPAPLFHRLGTLLRYGPGGQGSAVPLLLGWLLLLAILAGLAYIALGR